MKSGRSWPSTGRWTRRGAAWSIPSMTRTCMRPGSTWTRYTFVHKRTVLQGLCPLASTAAFVLHALHLCSLRACLKHTVCVATLARRQAKFCLEVGARTSCNQAVVPKATVQRAHVRSTSGTSLIQQRTWLPDLCFGPGNASRSCVFTAGEPEGARGGEGCQEAW